MENIKYHLLNIISVLLFSYVTAITVNQFFEFSILPAQVSVSSSRKYQSKERKIVKYEDYEKSLESGFFKRAPIDDQESPNISSSSPAGAIEDLVLLGTIAGPWSFSRAIIKKKTEKQPEIFKLKEDVYGYTLVRIGDKKVFLKTGEEVKILEMYAKGKKPATAKKASSSSKKISRSEIKQKVLNNLDNALRGLRAGPYRVDGKIEGYKIFRIRPYNILYKYGARSGDIIKRVNGHKIDSTGKLYKLWESMKGESKISVDIDRGGKSVNFDLSITE